MECMRSQFTEGAVLNGRFETISPLNHGSFGMVFVARDMETEEVVAVKCLTKPTSSPVCPNAVNIDDRSQEMACHARLGAHPNIVNLVHSFESDSHIYLVLEFCPMGDLYEAIRLGRGPLETEKVREFMLQLVDAVEYMHSKGIYHRDIKPENIFLTQTGDLKLGDFGLATTDVWSYESAVGSDRYMSPEQYDSAGSGYSPAKADTWAVGICLLNILFSRNPFVTPTESDPLFADFIRDRQSLFDIFPTMSQDTYEVLINALAMDPEKRSLSAVREALRRVINFTTDDESLDEFCTEDRELVTASANRQPLRTPSIQSPHVETSGSFPWAKALRLSPRQPVRQLSVVPDTEPYLDHAGSTMASEDWQHVMSGTPSIASILDSGLGASLKSIPVQDRNVRGFLPRSDPVPISTSVPINTNSYRPAMASVFGKHDGAVSKSWSDLWDEDEAEDEHERASQSWSEDQDQDRTLQPVDTTLLNRSLPAQATAKPLGSGLVRETLVSDAFEVASENETVDAKSRLTHPWAAFPPRPSPPRRDNRDIMDKWAALGDRRRAFTSGKYGKSASNAAVVGKWRRDVGLGVSGYGGGVSDMKSSQGSLMEDHHDDIGDLEWVGGWHDLHV